MNRSADDGSVVGDCHKHVRVLAGCPSGPPVARPRRMPVLAALSLLLYCGCAPGRSGAPSMLPQNPSPMAETARAHERLEPVDVPQAQRLAEGPLPGDVMVIPSDPAPGYGLLIHFHGAPYIPYLAARAGQPPMTVVAVNLGSGSSAYERPFLDPGAFPALVDSARARAGTDNRPERIFLSGFSAGYGAIRSILREHAERVDGVLLLDGLHASYVPEGRVLSAAGRVDSTDMAPFVAFARRAARGEKGFLFTHSEIFPGTYVSTTEAADFLLAELSLERTPVLEWGPVGMQQVSRAGSGAFAVLGFAGNTAPDHVDHLHGMPEFLALLLEEGRR